MRLTLLLVAAGIAVAALVYVATGGHVVSLPLILIFPLSIFLGRWRRRY